MRVVAIPHEAPDDLGEIDGRQAALWKDAPRRVQRPLPGTRMPRAPRRLAQSLALRDRAVARRSAHRQRRRACAGRRAYLPNPGSSRAGLGSAALEQAYLADRPRLGLHAAIGQSGPHPKPSMDLRR